MYFPLAKRYPIALDLVYEMVRLNITMRLTYSYMGHIICPIIYYHIINMAFGLDSVTKLYSEIFQYYKSR